MILYVISVGLSVTMGLMGFINLAHGVFAMAGGFVLSAAMASLNIVSMATARLIFGDQAARVFLPGYLGGQLHILGRDFPTYRAILIVISAAIIVLLWFGVERTRWGAMVRAAVDNRAMAQSVGI